MRHFDWEDFRQFAALAEELHLGRAAKRLHSSEATVMRRVQSLEHALGATLFVRRASGHALTPAGVKLLPTARAAEELLGDAIRLTREVDRAASGHVRIATTEVGALWILLPKLQDFKAKWPHIAMSIDANPQSVDLTQDLETVALRFQRPRSGPYVVRKLGDIAFALYGMPSLLGVTAKAQTAKFDVELPYCGWTGVFSEIRPARWLKEVFGRKLPALSLTTMQAHLDAACQGLVVCCLPGFVARLRPQLVRIGPPQLQFALEAWLVIPAQARRVTRIRAAAWYIEHAFAQAVRVNS